MKKVFLLISAHSGRSRWLHGRRCKVCSHYLAGIKNLNTARSMSFVNILCCTGRHPATNRSLVQGISTECGCACTCVYVCVTECDPLQQSLSIRPYVQYLDEADLKKLHLMTIYFRIYF